MATLELDLNFYPHLFQEEIFYDIINEKYFFYIICAGRQSGKSILLTILSIYLAVKSKEQILIVSPVEFQSKKLFKDIVSLIDNNTLIIKSKKESSGTLEINFFNGSTIIFRSATESIRGLSISRLFIDEMAFVGDSVIKEIILPTLTVKGKGAYFFSTPKGKNFFYNYFQKGLEGKDEKYKSYRYNSFDNIHANTELIEAQKEMMSDVQFRQEFMAEFCDADSIFKNINDLCTSQVDENYKGKKFAGIDVGIIKDSTVLTVLNDQKEMIFLKDYCKKDTNQIIKELTEDLNRLNCDFVYIEQNGQGLPIYQIIRENVANMVPYITTHNSKKEIINNLINDFNTKKIKILNNEVLKFQLESFLYIPDKDKFEGIKGIHDDYVMSLAIANEAFNKGSSNFSDVNIMAF